jgi:hypothetical protein
MRVDAHITPIRIIRKSAKLNPPRSAVRILITSVTQESRLIPRIRQQDFQSIFSDRSTRIQHSGGPD